MGIALKVVMIMMGVIIFFANLYSLSKRSIIPSFGVGWSIGSLLLIILGIFLGMDQLDRYMSWTAFFGLVFGVATLVMGGYIISLQISELFNRNMELIMQVSLLNEENVTFKRIIKEYEEKRGMTK